jgi:hypothetical protein
MRRFQLLTAVVLGGCGLPPPQEFDPLRVDPVPLLPPIQLERPASPLPDGERRVFPVRAGQLYRIVVRPNALPASAVLFDSRSAELARDASRWSGGYPYGSSWECGPLVVVAQAPADDRWTLVVDRGISSQVIEELAPRPPGPMMVRLPTQPLDQQIVLKGSSESFGIQAVAGRRYRVLATASVQDSCDDTRLEVVGELDGSLVAQGQLSAPNATAASFAAATSGLLVWTVRGESWWSGRFTLNLEELAGDDHGDTFADATLIDVPRSGSGVIEIESDVDMFELPSGGGSFTFSCTSTQLGACEVAAYDLAGTFRARGVGSLQLDAFTHYVALRSYQWSGPPRPLTGSYQWSLAGP